MDTSKGGAYALARGMAMLSWLLLLSCGTLAPAREKAPTSGLEPQVRGSGMEVIDRTGGFKDFLSAVEGASPEERLRLLKAFVVEPNRECYDFVPGMDDGYLGGYLRTCGPGAAVTPATTAAVVDRFEECLRSFRARFPEFTAEVRVFLLPSLGLFKGAALPRSGVPSILLGVDGLAPLDAVRLRGYLIHELFHAYHFQRVPEAAKAAELALSGRKMPPLWALLWTEGMASHAVRLVHPETAAEDVLDWAPLLRQTEAVMPMLVEDLLAALESDAMGDIAGFFYFPRPGRPDMPVGCGYYIGMLVAERLVRDARVEALLECDDHELLGRIRGALLEMGA